LSSATGDVSVRGVSFELIREMAILAAVISALASASDHIDAAL
jgi:hypothetical protein